MKRALLKGQLFKLTSIPLILTALLLTFFFNPAITGLLSGSYLALFILIYLISSEFGKKRLYDPQRAPHRSRLRWLLHLMGIEIIVMLLFITIGLSFFNTVPADLQSEVHATSPLLITLHASIVQWGLYPWTFYALLGICFGYFQKRDDASGLVKSLVLNVYQKPLAQDLLVPATDFLFRVSYLSSIAILIVSVILQCLHLLDQSLGLFDIQAFSYTSVLLSFIVYWIVITKFSQQWIVRLVRHQKSLGWLIVGYVIGMLILLFFLNWFIQYYLQSHYHFDLHKTQEIPSLHQNGWQQNWLLLMWLFGFGTIPAVTSAFIHISEGRTLREFILGVLILPLLLAVGYGFFQIQASAAMQQTLLHTLHTFMQSSLIQCAFPLFTLFFLFYTFKHTQDYARLDLGFMMNENKGSISRPGKTVNQLFQLTATLLAFAMLAWILVIPAFQLILLIPLLVIFSVAFFAFAFAVCNDI